MPVNSNAKGKRGERALAAYLTSLGFPARRGVQYRGGTDSPDVVSDGLDGVHIECKFGVHGLDFGTAIFDEAWEQCTRDAGGKHPALFWKPTGARQWRLTTCDPGRSRFTLGDDGLIQTFLQSLT